LRKYRGFTAYIASVQRVMKVSLFGTRPDAKMSEGTLTWVWPLLAAVAMGLIVAGCYNNNTGETNIGGAVSFKLPAFPETGANAVQIFTEMHYQPSYRAQEGPRILPPSDSIPLTGKEERYASLEAYQDLEVPREFVRSYSPANAQRLFTVNCVVCHGPTLRGFEEQQDSERATILKFELRGPLPANLTAAATKDASDGELFGFISGGGRQGLSAILRGRESASPMPEFGLLLTVEDRWALVRYLRSQIGP
jgi:mono/diheme cytochrome c family protein